QIESSGIVGRFVREQRCKALVKNNVPESLHQKSRRDQQHESKEDFIGAGIELYSTCREHGDECDDGGGKHDKGNLRYQPMNGQHCIKSVLNGLKKILQE